LGFTGTRNRVEESALPHIWKSDNASAYHPAS